MNESAMNRRGFLRLLGMGGAALAVPGAVASALVPEPEVHQWILDMAEYPGQPEDDCGRRYFDMGAHPDRIALQMRGEVERAIRQRFGWGPDVVTADDIRSMAQALFDANAPPHADGHYHVYAGTPRVENGITRLETKVIPLRAVPLTLVTEIQEGQHG